MSELVVVPASGKGAELALRRSLAARPDAPAILYLHGFGSSQDGEKADFFRRRAVAAGWSFVSLDFQGHGSSGGAMRDLSLSRCLDDVARARRHLRELGGNVALGGSSMGGLVALWHAARAPLDQRPRGLFLIAPAFGLEDTLRDNLGRDGMRRWRATGVLEVSNELGSFELGWEFVADLAKYPSSELTSLHRSPALVFQGQLDDRVPWRKVAAFAREAPAGTVRLELLEDGDHRLIDRLDWIWARSREFLEACNPESLRAVE